MISQFESNISIPYERFYVMPMKCKLNMSLKTLFLLFRKLLLLNRDAYGQRCHDIQRTRNYDADIKTEYPDWLWSLHLVVLWGKGTLAIDPKTGATCQNRNYLAWCLSALSCKTRVGNASNTNAEVTTSGITYSSKAFIFLNIYKKLIADTMKHTLYKISRIIFFFLVKFIGLIEKS